VYVQDLFLEDFEISLQEGNFDFISPAKKTIIGSKPIYQGPVNMKKRVDLMSKGIARFLDRTSSQNEGLYIPSLQVDKVHDEGKNPTGVQSSSDDTHEDRGEELIANESVLDKIRVTLDYAADILRESLE